MSSPRSHLIQGAVYTTVLYPFVGVDATIVGISSVMIDIDHVLQYVRDTRSVNPFGFFPYYDLLKKTITPRYLSIDPFHTIEFYVGLFVVGFYFPQVHFVLAGCLLHHLSDVVSQIRQKRLFCRAFSFVELVVRYGRGNYVNSLRTTLSVTDLQDPTFQRHMGWLKKWRMVSK